MIDIQQVRQWYDIFHGSRFTLNGVPDLVEVRLWGDNKNKVFSGYFRDVESLLAALQPFSEGYAIYSPINALHPGCGSRKQGMNQIVPYGSTASDSDITGRRWLFIDFDPVRPADTNSTDAEKEAARKVMKRTAIYLRDKGFKQPVYADSANGYHLYYAVHLEKNEETDSLCQDFLRTIDTFFGNDAVDVDLKVFNPARISKIIGTSSNKGISTEERPQRCSRFLKVPDVIEETDIAFIRSVVAEFPKPEKPSRENGYNTERFDLRGFIQKYGIEIVKEMPFKSGVKFILKECPFDSNHKAPDAALFQTIDGAVGFKCFHNSCSNKTWKDFRLHYDPNAYTHSYTPKQREYHKQDVPIVIEETNQIGKKWKQATDIELYDPSKYTFIPSGIAGLDKKIQGFALGELSLMTGLSGAGKSTLINHFILTAVQNNFKVAVWSGEMRDSQLLKWLDQAAAGPQFVVKKDGYDNWYYTPRNVCLQIHQWLGDRFYLYNNKYGCNSSQILADIEECVTKNGAQLIIGDNLMALNLDNDEWDSNKKETKFIWDLKRLAERLNVHIIWVAHPRKEAGFQLIRGDSIAGTGNLKNTANNVFILHRVNMDFERRGKEFFRKDKFEELLKYSNVLEANKLRENGGEDDLFGLYFDIPSKRFKNDIGEHIVYGWQPDDLPESTSDEFRQSAKAFDNPIRQEVTRPTQNMETYAEPSSFEYPLPPEDDLPF